MAQKKTISKNIKKPITDIYNPNRSKNLEDYLPPRHIGRPPKYDPLVHPAKAMNLLIDGSSLATTALKLKVDRDTIKEWRKKYPEFSAAIKKGIGYSQGWWEDQGHLNIDNGKFNSTLWYMNMKNRFGWNDPKSTYREFKIDGYKGDSITRLKALVKSVEAGTIPADVYKEYVSAIEKEVSIEEKVEVRKDVDRLLEATGLDVKEK